MHILVLCITQYFGMGEWSMLKVGLSVFGRKVHERDSVHGFMLGSSSY